MSADLNATFAALKPALSKHLPKLALREESDAVYSLNSRLPSPFPQHKGKPLSFGGLRLRKAWVSFHFMPVYMCPELLALISPALKARMHGKACFKFSSPPPPALLADLAKLTAAGLREWRIRKWV
jgi:hypothetical protein